MSHLIQNATEPNQAEQSVMAYIGIGANLGAPRESVESAIDALSQLPKTQLVAQSPLYGSAPLGENADGPIYTNAVAQIQTALTPDELLHELHQIEQHFGRIRTYKNAPRTLDLDILLYGNLVSNDVNLTLPHPRMHERAFVLLPLFDLNPDLTWHNALGQMVSVADLLPAVRSQEISRLD